MNNQGLIIRPIEAAVVKAAIATYSRFENEYLEHLYTRFEEYRAKFFSDNEMPNIAIAISKLNPKNLAFYTPKNGYGVPDCIEFNQDFIALNWGGMVVENDRNVVEHCLLHEMIHLWLIAVKGEKYKDAQAAHGRSFRKEAARIGVAGKGRLMACPYPVNMPKKERKAKAEPEPEPDRDNEPDSDNEPESNTDIASALATLKGYAANFEGADREDFQAHIDGLTWLLDNCEN